MGKKRTRKPYEKDPYFKQWFVGLSPRTKKNYTEEYNK
jgi:hypothetical protein